MDDKKAIFHQIQIFNKDNGIIKDLNGYFQVAQYKKLKGKFYLKAPISVANGPGKGRGGKSTAGNI